MDACCGYFRFACQITWILILTKTCSNSILRANVKGFDFGGVNLLMVEQKVEIDCFALFLLFFARKCSRVENVDKNSDKNDDKGNSAEFYWSKSKKANETLSRTENSLWNFCERENFPHSNARFLSLKWFQSSDEHLLQSELLRMLNTSDEEFSRFVREI